MYLMSRESVELGVGEILCESTRDDHLLTTICDLQDGKWFRPHVDLFVH